MIEVAGDCCIPPKIAPLKHGWEVGQAQAALPCRFKELGPGVGWRRSGEARGLEWFMTTGHRRAAGAEEGRSVVSGSSLKPHLALHGLLRWAPFMAGARASDDGHFAHGF